MYIFWGFAGLFSVAGYMEENEQQTAKEKG